MCAWLIGSIHSPACPALYSQPAFAGCTWITPCTVPTVSAPTPVATNFHRCQAGFGTFTRRAWKIVSRAPAAKHQYPTPITPAPAPTGTLYHLPMLSFAVS